MSRFFIFIYDLFKKRRLFFGIILVIICLILGWFASKIELEEDITKFIPSDKNVDKINNVFKNINVADKLIIRISFADTSILQEPDSLITFADKFTDKLAQQFSPSHIKEINYKISDDLVQDMYQPFYQNLPLFLDDKDYKKLDTLVTEKGIQEIFENNRKLLLSPAGMFFKQTILGDPLNLTLSSLSKLKLLQVDKKYELYNSCIFTKDQKSLVLFIVPAFPTNETYENGKLLDGIESISKSISLEYPAIQLDYFGAIAVGVGNARQVKLDSLYTTAIALVLIVILLSFYFRKKRALFFIVLPVAFGGLFALALMFLLKTQISAIALGAGSIIFGIAVNYSLHVFAHAQHKNSVYEVIKDLAAPLVIGSATTVGAFLSLLFVKSPALNDFGLISALSLIGAILFCLLVLPHFLKETNTNHILKSTFIEKWSSYSFENNKYLLLVIFLLTIVFAYFAGDVAYESDISKINYMSDKLKHAQEEITENGHGNQKKMYLVATGNRLEQAIKNNEKIIPLLEQLKADSVISTYSHIGLFIMSDSIQNEKIARWNSYWTNPKKDSLKLLIAENSKKYKMKESAFQPFFEMLNKEYKPVDVRDLTQNFGFLMRDFINIRDSLAMVITMIDVVESQVPVVNKAFKDVPDAVILDKKYIAEKFLEGIKFDFNMVLLFCSLLVFTFLTLSYGRIELSFIAFAPMVISWLWILGIMSLFDIKFNIINIIISTFIFGLGDDFSIFMMDGLKQEFTNRQKILNSYKTSIFLSALTMLIGIGVLVFAKHPAMKSLAYVTIIGMFTVVIISYTVSPFLFKWLISIKGRRRVLPLTFHNLLKSIAAFTVFFVGSILLSLYGFTVYKVLRMQNPKGRLLFHKALKWVSKFVVDILLSVKTTIINDAKEDFKNPCIMISNHQSHIDLVLIMMLYPKIIILTNDWVWRNPFYGFIIRFAHFYPVSSGVEQNIELFKSKVDEGYSILVFPEGTRSVEGKINRFHKGAFYLANELKLDILPIVIHGICDCVTKGELVLKTGSVKVKILPRVKYGDKQFGEENLQQTKLYRKMMVRELSALKDEYETPAYFNTKIVHNYIYKGASLEWYVRLKLRLEKNYETLLSFIPKQGKILDLACGYGEFSLLAALHSEGRNVLAIDEDPEKIELASNCYSVPKNLNYKSIDDIELKEQTFDCIHFNFDSVAVSNRNELFKICLTSIAPDGLMIVSSKGIGKKDRIKEAIINQLEKNIKIVKKLDQNKLEDMLELAKVQGYGVETISNPYVLSNYFIIRKQ